MCSSVYIVYSRLHMSLAQVFHVFPLADGRSMQSAYLLNLISIARDT